MLQKKENKLFIQLASEVDEFRFAQLSSNAQFEELHKPNGNIYFEVSSIKEAKVFCSKFISDYNLGSSNWTGGRIVDEQFNFIAQISYNGRIWSSDDFLNAQEIIID